MGSEVPAVVVTQDADSALLQVGGTASTLSLAGSPRHQARVHPANLGSTFDVSCADYARWHIPVEPKVEEEPPQRWYSLRRTLLGTLLVCVVCGAWVAGVHLLKWSYNATGPNANATGNASAPSPNAPFRAPFLATWIFTACYCGFFPLFLCLRRRDLDESWDRLFRGKGLSPLHLLTRSLLFCALWAATQYMLVFSARRLDATACMALLASSAAFIYLLSWVILHEQFVGIRIVAVIMCSTGIALLAYMDGVSRTSTLGGVVMASASAAGLAVFRVLFQKLIGGVDMCQLSLFLSLLGALDVLCLWPVGLTLYLVGAETLSWPDLPYPQLAGTAAAFMVTSVLCNFDLIRRYDLFLKLGLLCAVPVSAVVDVQVYRIVFKGMKLAGILLIFSGYVLVLLPDDWPDYLTWVLRWRCRKAQPEQKPVAEKKSTH